ncbi:YheU family protein [Rheinheimera sp. MMS21-TC3]|uniref:YheU family protein n=1 Tax=Rheinheimera sp. MMS21-TC3 TaxID=3072790 RepID=UPI0028C40F24|nr:YheU family protein [Rheinheimera sp. MMS21-TC3]WNO59842.1 YheU family protein [Rheinheimera sp. MMS21-TC3]
MIIPHQQLDTDTLNNLIEYYVLREGTDYGDQEVSLTDKVQHVMQQLNAGDIVIVFSELHQSINLMPKQQFNQLPPEAEQ